MAESNIIHGTADQFPKVSQKLKLSCRKCGEEGVYNVGAIFSPPAEKEDSQRKEIAFTNYFRCAHCGSAGPWDVVDYLKLTGLLIKSVLPGAKGFKVGYLTLFDGTFIQTPAMGEEHLLKLLEKEPRNAFLHTRLGNLLRSAGLRDKAAEWYEKAIELDPGDVEARYHLFDFAKAAGDIDAEIRHATLLAEHLLAGRSTNKEDLDKGLTEVFVHDLLTAPEEFQDHFRNLPMAASASRGEKFIRNLLEVDGDHEELVEDGAGRLLRGEVFSRLPVVELDEFESIEDETDMKHVAEVSQDLIPSLKEAAAKEGLNPAKLSAGLLADKEGVINIGDRHEVIVSDTEKMASWQVGSLRDLFRGDRKPPPDSEMSHYPPEYAPYFYFIESHVLLLAGENRDQTDQEMEQIFATIRRRPDGRSLGPAHDFMWQVCAVLLGKYPLSGMQFEAIVGQLERSVRHWALRPVSRNYIDFLRKSFGGE